MTKRLTTEQRTRAEAIIAKHGIHGADGAIYFGSWIDFEGRRYQNLIHDYCAEQAEAIAQADAFVRMEPVVKPLCDALRVLLLDPKIRAAIDPMAYRQALAALEGAGRGLSTTDYPA